MKIVKFDPQKFVEGQLLRSSVLHVSTYDRLEITKEKTRRKAERSIDKGLLASACNFLKLNSCKTHNLCYIGRKARGQGGKYQWLKRDFVVE